MGVVFSENGVALGPRLFRRPLSMGERVPQRAARLRMMMMMTQRWWTDLRELLHRWELGLCDDLQNHSALSQGLLQASQYVTADSVGRAAREWVSSRSGEFHRVPGKDEKHRKVS